MSKVTQMELEVQRGSECQARSSVTVLTACESQLALPPTELTDFRTEDSHVDFKAEPSHSASPLPGNRLLPSGLWTEP